MTAPYRPQYNVVRLSSLVEDLDTLRRWEPVLGEFEELPEDPDPPQLLLHAGDPRLDMADKECLACHVVKPAIEFRKREAKLQSYCRICQDAKSAARWLTIKDLVIP